MRTALAAVLLVAVAACGESAEAGVEKAFRGYYAALLARDFRTANNLNGIMLGPLILIVLIVLVAIPRPANFAVLVAVLLACGALATLAGLRWLTFERYLA